MRGGISTHQEREGRQWKWEGTRLWLPGCNSCRSFWSLSFCSSFSVSGCLWSNRGGVSGYRNCICYRTTKCAFMPFSSAFCKSQLTLPCTANRPALTPHLPASALRLGDDSLFGILCRSSWAPASLLNWNNVHCNNIIFHFLCQTRCQKALYV